MFSTLSDTNSMSLATCNPLPNDKILDVTKLKAFADDRLNINKMTISICDTVGNTGEKGKNAGYQHFLLFLQCFQKPSSLKSQ